MNRNPSGQLTHGGSEPLCRIKYQNNLPDIPFDPKSIVYPFNPTRFVQYNSTSLEKQFKWDILNEQDLGVRIDLINQDYNRVDPDGLLFYSSILFKSQLVILFQYMKSRDAQSGREVARRRDNLGSRLETSRTTQQNGLLDEKKRVHLNGEHAISTQTIRCSRSQVLNFRFNSFSCLNLSSILKIRKI